MAQHLVGVRTSYRACRRGSLVPSLEMCRNRSSEAVSESRHRWNSMESSGGQVSDAFGDVCGRSVSTVCTSAYLCVLLRVPSNLASTDESHLAVPAKLSPRPPERTNRRLYFARSLGGVVYSLLKTRASSRRAAAEEAVWAAVVRP